MRLRKTAMLTAAMVLLTGASFLTGCGETKRDVAEKPETLTNNQFVMTLYPDYAPETCENFQNLVEQGFYNGLIFHRVMEGFMAQGGDPTGTGMGGSEQTIKGEFSSNGFTKNTLSHTRGVVSMARSMEPDSASSQFFICYSDDDTFLDGNYAAFGKVTEGMEVVDDFLTVGLSMSSSGELSSPNSPIVIDTAILVTPDDEKNPRVLFTMQDFRPADGGESSESAAE